MQFKKPIFKKEYEHVDNVDEAIWLGNDSPIMESDFTFVFNDKYPCVPGHKLFIPKENNSHFIGRSYGMAYDYGNEKIKKGEIDGYNVGMNIGLCGVVQHTCSRGFTGKIDDSLLSLARASASCTSVHVQCR